MKREVKNSNGITLVALVITIIVLLILASVTTYSGISIINTSKLTTFTTEMKIMQTQVNQLYQKYKDGETIQVGDETYTGEAILTMRKNSTDPNYSTDIENSSLKSYSQAEKVFAIEESGITDKTGYLYFNKNLIQDLNIEGVEQEFFINISTRSVVSYKGLKYEDKMYYTLEQLPNSIYNVDYIDKNNEKPVIEETKIEQISNDKWRITISKIKYDGYVEKWQIKYQLEGSDYWNTSEELSFVVNEDGKYFVKIQNGSIESEQVEVDSLSLVQAPEEWLPTRSSDAEWYNYGDEKVNEPKLKGKMTPIKYDGESQDGNRWANAITADGSMWVWIPRYAYKITKGYHGEGLTYSDDTTTEAGTIEIKFLQGATNKFIDGTGTAETDPSKITYTNGVQDQWLVHPAFLSDASIGGGFGSKSGDDNGIIGFWVGKFEATGSYNSDTKTGVLSVKPGFASLCNMTINEQYKLAKSSSFGEKESLNSHMSKNSEWGAVAYLGHSKYGTNGLKIENNDGGYLAGGNETKSEIYTKNKMQSTTHNATGVYDMNGGAWDRTASYVNNENENLETYGGTSTGDLYGANSEERSTSTAYKTVYESVNDKLTDYNTSEKYKGGAVYETSNSGSSKGGSWFGSYAIFPNGQNPFFIMSGLSGQGGSGTFYFSNSQGIDYDDTSFRVVLAF